MKWLIKPTALLAAMISVSAHSQPVLEAGSSTVEWKPWEHELIVLRKSVTINRAAWGKMIGSQFGDTRTPGNG